MINYDTWLNIWIELGTKDDRQRIVLVGIARSLEEEEEEEEEEMLFSSHK